MNNPTTTYCHAYVRAASSLGRTCKVVSNESGKIATPSTTDANVVTAELGRHPSCRIVVTDARGVMVATLNVVEHGRALGVDYGQEADAINDRAEQMAAVGFGLKR